MDKNKLKEGVSIKEIEGFGKKYRFEIFFLAYFILASFFTFLFFGASWSIYLAGLGGILGVFLPRKLEKASQACFRFVFKQERITQIILGIVGVIVSIFLPPLIFFMLGLMGGFGVFTTASGVHGTKVHTEEHHHEEF